MYFLLLGLYSITLNYFHTLQKMTLLEETAALINKYLMCLHFMFRHSMFKLKHQYYSRELCEDDNDRIVQMSNIIIINGTNIPHSFGHLRSGVTVAVMSGHGAYAEITRQPVEILSAICKNKL